MSDRNPAGADPRIVGVIAGVVVIVLVVVVIGLLRDEADPVGIDGDLTATPLASATEATSGPTASAPPPPSAPESTPTPGEAGETGGAGEDGGAEDGEGGPREPTDADAADFVEVVAPAEQGSSQVVLADLDGDSRNEVVVASMLSGRSRIDVGSWTGSAYRVGYSGEGGTAEQVVSVEVRDINGVPDTLEVVVRQTSGTQGESISVWGVRDGQVVPLQAVDGCWDGSHTYGITGVSLGSQRITATCDGSPDPVAAWPSDIYVWDPELDAFLYERTVE